MPHAPLTPSADPPNHAAPPTRRQPRSHFFLATCWTVHLVTLLSSKSPPAIGQYGRLCITLVYKGVSYSCVPRVVVVVGAHFQPERGAARRRAPSAATRASGPSFTHVVLHASHRLTHNEEKWNCIGSRQRCKAFMDVPHPVTAPTAAPSTPPATVAPSS